MKTDCEQKAEGGKFLCFSRAGQVFVWSSRQFDPHSRTWDELGGGVADVAVLCDGPVCVADRSRGVSSQPMGTIIVKPHSHIDCE